MAALTDALGYGVIGSRPAAGSPGRIYFSTEPATYRDNGSSWDDVSDAGAGGAVATDAIWDAAGDLAVGSGADTAGRLAIGAAGTNLYSDGSAVSWRALASARYLRTSGDYSTTSTSFTDVDGTNLALTITTGAHRVLVGFVGSVYNSAANGHTALTVAVDGTDQGDASLGLVLATQHATASESIPASFTYLTASLSAGSHTFKLRYRAVTAGTSTINGNSPQMEFFVMEQGG